MDQSYIIGKCTIFWSTSTPCVRYLVKVNALKIAILPVCIVCQQTPPEATRWARGLYFNG